MLLTFLDPNILHLILRQLLMNTYYLCMTALDTNQIRLSYNKVNFKHTLNILSFVCLDICVLLHIDCIRRNVSKALCDLLLMSVSAPSFVVFIVQRYLKLSPVTLLFITATHISTHLFRIT